MSGAGSSNTAAELQVFRDRWKNELTKQIKPDDNDVGRIAHQDAKILNEVSSSPVQNSVLASPENSYDESPFPFQFTDSLLRSWQETPPSRSKPEKRSAVDDSLVEVCQSTEKKPRKSLVDVYIDDLNELDDIPFFDISLPREIAVRIFSFLSINDLCACSQVSSAWGNIANDNLIWERLYHRIRLTFTGQSSINQSDNWKETVKNCFIHNRTLLLNWKEHKCHITYYHHAQGGVLTSAHSLNDMVVAGYTNGQVKLWNIVNQDTQTYEPSNKSLQLLNEDDDAVLGTSENAVTCVKLGQNDTLIAGYKHGQVQVWNYSDVSSMVVSEFTDYCVKEVITNDDLGYVLLNHQSNSSTMIKVLSLGDNCCEVVDHIQIRGEGETWTLPQHLIIALPTHSVDTVPLIYLSRDSLNIHRSTTDTYTSRRYYNSTQVEEFYATHFTCLESSLRFLNLGFTSHLGLQAEYKVRQYDVNTLGNISDLRGHTSQVTCIDSSFSTGFMICTGCHDRRVRLYDSRLPSYAVHTYMGHPSAIQCIQSDDWKIVSGDMEGYICAWDQRMGSKFWESQSRHPVKYLNFTCQNLVSANIPVRTNEEHFDGDRMTHLRYRGRLQLSDFSVEHSLSDVPSICSSSYDVPEASNYNISLITPYDSI